MQLKVMTETLAASIIQAPTQQTIASGTFITGAITGDIGGLVIQVLAGILSVSVIYKTWQDIRINNRKLRKEKVKDE